MENIIKIIAFFILIYFPIFVLKHAIKFFKITKIRKITYDEYIHDYIYNLEFVIIVLCFFLINLFTLIN